MNYLKEFNRLMAEQSELALATCVNNDPNVRIVNFYYDADHKGIAYFATFGKNPKVDEISANNVVAFTTIPTKGNEHVRAKNATVKKSNFTIFDFKNQFIEKIPDYQSTIEQVGKQLVLYEIHFQEANITLDMMHSGKITL